MLETIAARGRVSDAKPLRNLENIAAGELARWIKQTTPNDRPHVVRMLRRGRGHPARTSWRDRPAPETNKTRQQKAFISKAL